MPYIDTIRTRQHFEIVEDINRNSNIFVDHSQCMIKAQRGENRIIYQPAPHDNQGRCNGQLNGGPGSTVYDFTNMMGGKCREAHVFISDTGGADKILIAGGINPSKHATKAARNGADLDIYFTYQFGDRKTDLHITIQNHYTYGQSIEEIVNQSNEIFKPEDMIKSHAHDEA